MRRMLLISALLLAILPLASAQFITFSTTGEINVLSGDYTEGSFTLSNDAELNFDIVSFKEYKVVDERFNEVKGFTLELEQKIHHNWNSTQERKIKYKLSANESVKAGRYQLLLTFWGFLHSGDVYIITARVPVNVIDKPLIFKEASSYVKERPLSANYALNGETIVVYSHVESLKRSIMPLKAVAYLEREGKKYSIKEQMINITKGDNIVKLEVPVPYNIPSGRYKLIYELSYKGGSYIFSKEYFIQFGVEISSISLKSTSVLEDETNEAYVTITSERNIPIDLTLEIYGENNQLLRKEVKRVELKRGTNVYKFELYPEKSGDMKVSAKIFYNGTLLGEVSTFYKVIAIPKIEKISINQWKNEKKADFTLIIINSNSMEVKGSVEYKIYTGKGILYKGKSDLLLLPGKNELKLTFDVPEREKVFYKFKLMSFEREIVKEGEVLFKWETPTPTTTTEKTTTTSSPIQPTTQIEKKVEYPFYKLGLAAVVIVTTLLLYTLRRPRKTRRRRERPKPKRKSPLGKKPKKFGFFRR